MPLTELIIAWVMGGAIVIGSFGTIALQFLNKRHFDQVCELYKKEFGELPMEAQLFKNFYDPMFYGYKTDFIFRPLIKNQIPKKINSKPGVDDRAFIRNLPKNIQWWFKLEYYFPIYFMVIFAVCFLILKFYFKANI